MSVKRVSALLLLAIVFFISLIIGWNSWNDREDFPQYNRFYFMAEYMEDIEAFVQDNFPYRQQLENSAVKLGMVFGEKKFDNIFIGDDILIEDIGQPDQEILLQNLREIKAFVQVNSSPVSVLYLPTKYAIKQKDLPEDAEYFAFNQKAFIEESYKQLSGLATTVDAYSTLLSNSDKYLFYRTDDELTGLGAYYVYSSLVQRMGLTAFSQDHFDQRHVSHSYLGDTYEASPYKEITPDIITVYYPTEQKSCMVTHYNDYRYSYNTLYPEHKEGLDVILGGNSGDISISSGLKRQRSLLVFGDSSTLPLLPLLSAHYYKIHFIDFEYWNENTLDDMDIGSYDQVLLSYSVDTLIHDSYPSKIELIRKQISEE